MNEDMCMSLKWKIITKFQKIFNRDYNRQIKNYEKYIWNRGFDEE